MSLVKDLADTLRAVVAARATGMPIDPILPEVKAVLERAEAAHSTQTMNDEQKARLARLTDDLDSWRWDDQEWLLALVKELDEENAWLQGEADREFHRGQRTAVENPDGPIAIMLESLTAELDRANRAALANGELSLENHSRAMRAEQQLAELEQAAKKWEADREDAITRAEKAEAERDALRTELAAANAPVLACFDCPQCHKPHIDEGEFATRKHKTHRCVDDAAGHGCGHEWRPALIPIFGVSRGEMRHWQEDGRELARLKGGE